MWKHLFNLFRKTSNPNLEAQKLLRVFLSDPSVQESFLGGSRMKRPSLEEQFLDIESFEEFSKLKGYQIWVKEIWSSIQSSLLSMLAKSSNNELHFERGQVTMALKILQIPYRVKAFKEAVLREKEALRASREREEMK